MPKRKQYPAYKNQFNKDNYKVLAVRLPIRLVDDFKAECAKRSIPQAQVIRKAVEEFLEEEKK